MTKRIKVADLPDFDDAPYLDSEEAVRSKTWKKKFMDVTGDPNTRRS